MIKKTFAFLFLAAMLAACAPGNDPASIYEKIMTAPSATDTTITAALRGESGAVYVGDFVAVVATTPAGIPIIVSYDLSGDTIKDDRLGNLVGSQDYADIVAWLASNWRLVSKDELQSFYHVDEAGSK